MAWLLFWNEIGTSRNYGERRALASAVAVCWLWNSGWQSDEASDSLIFMRTNPQTATLIARTARAAWHMPVRGRAWAMAKRRVVNPTTYKIGSCGSFW